MKNVRTFKQMKQKNEPIVMLTAYDYPSAKLAEEAGIDMILVGDSLGMVVLGYDSTTPVTVDDMIHHGKATRRGAKDTFVVVDMPFMSYHISVEETVKTAQKMMQETSANALKLEGADKIVIEGIERLTDAGVAVVAHLGLTPQSVGVIGGYLVQGKGQDEAKQMIDDAINCQNAGACALVLECVPKHLAKQITEILEIPVIGIGAGNETDGQVLVYHDVLGYGSVRVPSFVKKYADVQSLIKDSLEDYTNEVRNKQFPTDEQSFFSKETELMLYGGK